MDREPVRQVDGREPTEEEWAAAVTKAIEDQETGTGEEGFGVYLPMFPYLPLHEPVVIDDVAPHPLCGGASRGGKRCRP